MFFALNTSCQTKTDMDGLPVDRLFNRFDFSFTESFDIYQ